MTPRASELRTTWHTSSYSGNGGNCVEVGDGLTQAVPVRDSKDPHGPALMFAPDAWAAFVAAIRAGELLPGG
ncbi:DUF397 domain-containing protein [Streptacidiphilus sp. PB12-B1b]|uniref:DUF397 domain-containing protein n=1 Tax=Streptacidiphilus sp. PB12-B1b TaxID=2705012 RepID=UPI0015FB442B|nr:DUF397 domain-containing protein [Streptacidiphilus sp. PB12-B1b]QMU79488.1 DUF397 domain-containing protein [Streptacidiphilus sp. PB12-B1b]